MVKYLLLGFLYGIPSERQIEQWCADSNEFRWYLGVELDERAPDHSIINQPAAAAEACVSQGIPSSV